MVEKTELSGQDLAVMFNDPAYLAELNQKLDTLNDLLYQRIGLNRGNNQVDITKGFNYTERDFTTPHRERYGYTFFTRPKLNLSSGNLKAHRILSMLETKYPNSVQFAIRCLLDSIFSFNPAVLHMSSKSVLFDMYNPFIPILTNRIKSMSGFPDIVLETYTSEGGFFSEDISLAKGWDNLSKSYDLQATFVDVRGSFIFALFLVWLIWIDCSIKGSASPYKRYIEQRRVSYTISIYRFIMDETNTYITKWAKATGCFPISLPIGAYFNFDIQNPYITESMNLSINFKVAGKIEYMDPIVLKDFNKLVEMYRPDIKSLSTINREDIPNVNCKIVPYIDLQSGYNELLWKSDVPVNP